MRTITRETMENTEKDVRIKNESENTKEIIKFSFFFVDLVLIKFSHHFFCSFCYDLFFFSVY